MAEERMQQSAGAEQKGAAAPDASPQARPGVPLYAKGVRPIGGNAPPLPRMGDDARHLKRLGLKRLTPIYGTANPPHGVAGAMRRLAYQYPENLARHWMTLLLADRVDVVEDRLGGLLERPLAAAGLERLGRTVHRNPFGALAVVAGGLWLTGKLLAPSRK